MIRARASALNILMTIMSFTHDFAAETPTEGVPSSREGMDPGQPGVESQGDLVRREGCMVDPVADVVAQLTQLHTDLDGLDADPDGGLLTPR